MSASKDKIARRELRDAGQDKRQLAQEKEAAERRKSRTKYILVAVAIVVVFAFIFLYNSALPSRTLTGVTIDGEEYSVAELNYYYSSAYQTFYNNYYQYIQYGMFFDTSASLADQMYDENESWREYFLNEAVADMKQIKALCEAGEAAGYEMSEDAQTSYDESVASLQTAWQTNGYSSLGQFLNMVYGKGVTEELVENELYRSIYASDYAQYLYDSYEYTPEELSTYYSEYADDFDMISYASYYAYAGEEDDGSTETELAALAEAVDGTDLDSFNEYLNENFDGAYADEATTEGSSLSTTYSEWLLDSAREAGDATMIDADGSYYVVMFLGRDNNQYNTRAFRHILIKAEDTDGDEVTSEEEIQAAIDEANDVYDEWLAGDATEESFIALVEEYSDDAGSNTEGGLYEDVAKNQMVAPVNDWLFDVAAEPGDSGVVEYNEGGSYSGGHVMYYVGESEETYADQLADTEMRTNTVNEWLEEAVGAMESSLSNTAPPATTYS